MPATEPYDLPNDKAAHAGAGAASTARTSGQAAMRRRPPRKRAPSAGLATEIIRVSHDDQENRHSDLASLSLTAAPDGSTIVWLTLSIEFGEYTTGLTGGTVRYFLKRAELRFALSGCQMPVETRSVVSEFVPSVDAAREMSRDRGTEGVEEVGDTLTVGAKTGGLSVKNATKIKTSRTQSEKLGVLDKVAVQVFTVRTGGGPTSPHWIFVPQPGDDMIYGTNKTRSWGALELSGQTATIDAVIRIARDDIGCVGVGGIWPSVMTRRQNRVFRALALSIINRVPHVSRVVLSFYKEPGQGMQ
jgi:hypothetical protein